MRRLLTMILCMLLATSMMAGKVKARYNQSNDPTLDNLVLRINIKYNQLQNEAIGRLNIDTYHTAVSLCEQQTWLGKLLRNVVPFQASYRRKYALEALSQVRYQWPGDVQYNTVALRANSKRHGKMMLREAYECLLPIYDMRRKGADTRSFVMPFSNEGLRQYHFAFVSEEADTIFSREHPRMCRIMFWPVTKHHTLFEGELLVDSANIDIVSLRWKGRIDFAKIDGQMDFQYDSVSQMTQPVSNNTLIHYNWLGAKATNRYISHFKYNDYIILDSLDRWNQPLDLTSTYKAVPLREANFDTIRTVPISPYIDEILTPKKAETLRDTTKQKEPNPAEDLITLATGLVDGTSIGDEKNKLRIYGPLDPAAFDYNKIDGFSIREKFRWDRYYADDSFIKFRGTVGFAFKLKELRYNLNFDWEYRPESRQKLSLEASRRGSGFSSKFVNTINQAIKESYRYPDSINFYSLGVEYYQHYRFQLEHANELTNGLMLYLGAGYNFRNPVKHGLRAVSKEQSEQLIKDHYADFSPYFRLEWTPRQYYMMEGKRKVYISSPSPTFSFEAARAFRNIFGADSDYSRMEFDVHQDIRIRPSRVFAYHIGAGSFLRQKGEYFINYRYFSRHMYTSQHVEDRLGGAFQLLDDYWYSSSPAYVQSHFMFATPFGIMHTLPAISKYAIQERFYLGYLWAKGKKGLYTELGYGFSNNYFSLGAFAGFARYKYYSAGVKFSIEIGDHL